MEYVVLYRVHKCLRLQYKLSQINPVHILTPCSSEIKINVILHFTSISSQMVSEQTGLAVFL
jgi:hypothetical protein